MNNKALEIGNQIRKIAASNPPLLFPAIVSAVSADGDTCSIEINNDLQLSNVRLRTVSNPESTNTLLIKPRVGSTVLVADLSKGELRNLSVVQFSDIDEIILNEGSEVMVNGYELKKQLEAGKYSNRH